MIFLKNKEVIHDERGKFKGEASRTA